MSGTSENTIQSVETSFEIIELLRRLNGAGVTEIAERLDIPVSTTHNHLSTLRQKGYVSKSDDEYYVGLKFVYLGDHAKNRLDIFNVAEQYIGQLAEKTGEVANLMVENGGFGIYLKVARSDDALNLESYSRRREYLHCTAAGKAILAFESEQKVNNVIETHGLVGFTERTITTREQLNEDLERIRDDGYSFDDEERLDGLRCVAAPLLSEEEDVLGAISVSGPTTRMGRDRFREELPEMVYNTAKAIEIEMIHS
jgi:DNA-binding IclR family transcriptional regulator